MDNPFNEGLLGSQLETGRDYSGGPWRSLRPLGWGSVVCGVLWLFGLGSLFAIVFGLIGIVGRHQVASKEYPPPGLRMCVVGAVLGVVGLVATVVVYLTL